MKLNDQDADARVAQSKDWRQRMDVILQEMKTQQSGERKTAHHESGRHLAISITHTEDAIMRFGMRMKEVEATNPGSAPNPYPKSYDATSRVVEPTSDGIKL